MGRAFKAEERAPGSVNRGNKELGTREISPHTESAERSLDLYWICPHFSFRSPDLLLYKDLVGLLWRSFALISQLGPSQSELCTYLTTMMNVIHSGTSS